MTKRSWANAPYYVQTTEGQTFHVTLQGRDLWALEALKRAGLDGCTPVDNPAPRWSAYVHRLRGLGIEIETVTETHGGDFAGHHGRYVLRSTVTRLHMGGAA